MPGIVGILGKSFMKEKASSLEKMLQCMLHEDFYTSGSYINEEAGLCIGWVNRAGSFSDCMPLWNETRDVCLIFYGENFADTGLIDTLQRRELDPRNARYLIHLYEQREELFPESLNGWFSGVLLDLRKRKGMLFNDRYGMQRIYFHESKEALFFSSEAKSLLKVCPKLRRLDPKSLGEMLSFGCVLNNRSLFSDLFLLPPGSAWTFENGSVTRKRHYFTPEAWEEQPPMEKEPFYAKIRETFTRILPKYFVTNSSIALSLTGGLDTRMILASAAVPPQTLPCYTFGGMYRDCFDVKFSRRIAKLCQQQHTVLGVDRAFFSEFPSLAEKAVYVTDGYLDVSGSVELYVNRKAREIAPVRLTGNYGSEILRGSRHLKASTPPQRLFDAGFEKYFDAAAETLDKHCRGNRITFAAFKQTPWHHYNRLSLEQSQVTLRSPYLDNDLVELMYRAPAELLDSNELSLRLIRDGNAGLGSIMTDRGVGGDNGYARSKLARLYHEFLFKADYAFNEGMPQWYAKLDHRLLRPFSLESIFLGRHKFYHFRVWFRDELSGYVKEILLDPISLKRPYLNGKTVERMVLDHTSGRLNHTTELTKLLTIELLHRLMLDERQAG